MEGVEQSKAKYTHSMDTLWNPFEYWVEISNEKHDINRYIVAGTCGKGLENK
jgi:hypothetical protein